MRERESRFLLKVAYVIRLFESKCEIQGNL